MKTIPTLSADLIEQMDKDEGKFEVKPGMNLDEIMFKAGRRALVDELIRKLEQTPSHDQQVILK